MIGSPRCHRSPGSPPRSRSPPDPPSPPPERFVTATRLDSRDPGTREFDLLVEPAPGSAETERRFRVRVRVRGCGTEDSAALTLRVAGAVDLGGFCGVTTGAACTRDEGCARAGCGEVCAGLESTGDLGGDVASVPGYLGAHCFRGACADPVPPGATCGCLSGACTWRLP